MAAAAAALSVEPDVSERINAEVEARLIFIGPVLQERVAPIYRFHSSFSYTYTMMVIVISSMATVQCGLCLGRHHIQIRDPTRL